MFEALIMICLAQNCKEFRDDYGPYVLESMCETRAKHMMSDASNIIDDINVKYYWKCIKKEGI